MISSNPIAILQYYVVSTIKDGSNANHKSRAISDSIHMLHLGFQVSSMKALTIHAFN
jgi:hypothetical protein